MTSRITDKMGRNPRSRGNEGLACDICESTDIIETAQGYVCKDCGVELNVPKFAFKKPYNECAMQHEILSATQIGSKHERRTSPDSRRLARMNRLHAIRDREKSVEMKTSIEISRIFEELHLPSGFEHHVLVNFKKVRGMLQSGTKYRNPKKLIPLMIYYTFKVQCLSVNKDMLICESIIDKKDFNSFLLTLKQFAPNYATRNRRKFISQKIMEITEQFGLGMPFYYQCKKIMDELWEGIKNTKDDVIAGLACSMAALCMKGCTVPVSRICTHLGIRMSTMQLQVKKRIIDRFKVPGFVSLVKSSDLLRTVMVRLNIIEDDEPNENENLLEEASEKVPEMIMIRMGAAMQVFNSFNNDEYYHFMLSGDHDSVVNVFLRIENEKGTNNRNEFLRDFRPHECDFLMFNDGKGPPSFLLAQLFF